MYSSSDQFWNSRNPENMHNTLFIIVAHLDDGTFIRKLIVEFSYCVLDLTALICEKITF